MDDRVGGVAKRRAEEVEEVEGDVVLLVKCFTCWSLQIVTKATLDQ